jgi:membrane protease YdiL (CAAX protease family)
MNNIERSKTLWHIVIFSVLVNVVAWIAPALGGTPSSPGLGFVLWGTAPLVVSLIMRLVTRDWSDLGIKPAFRKNVWWYLFSLLAFPAIMLLTLLIGVLFSVSTVSEFPLGQFLKTTLTALPIFFIFAIFEEVGWRGYLSPKLDALGVNRFISSGIVALVWATWHLPYIRELSWVYSSEDLTAFIPRFYLLCFALSFVYGEVRSITGTFWPAVLFHAVGNAFGHPLSAEYVKVTSGWEGLASISNGFFVITIVFAVGVAINRWRTREIASSKSFI